MKIPLFVAAVMCAGIMISGSALRAANTGLCGDGTVDADEQCDDGNLKNGDGCSNQCTNEECGNGILDPSEQCDNGMQNGTAGNTCSLTCMILFCGDGSVDTGNGEQCDDGNNVSNDGCSATCELEGVHFAASASSSSSEAASASSTASASLSVTSSASASSSVPRRIIPAIPVPPVQPALPSIRSLAAPAVQFLTSPEGIALQEALMAEERQSLLFLLGKLTQGERLTPEERTVAAALAGKLEEVRMAQRNTYAELLRAFIATAISSDVVSEKSMRKDRLIGADIRAIIAELAAKATVIPAAEIPAAIAGELESLSSLGVTLQGLPSDFTVRLSPERTSLEVFKAVKTVKEATEKLAAKDLMSSLETIQSQAEVLRQTLPDLEREYGLQSADVEQILITIAALAERGQPEDREEMAKKAAELLARLSEAGIVSWDAIGTASLQPLHPAASAERLAQEFAPERDVVTEEDAVAFIHELASKAPAEYRSAFKTGTLAEQQRVLRSLLQDETRTTALLDLLRRDGRTDFDERLKALREDIDRIGSGNHLESAVLCDDSVSHALTCVNTFLADLQEAARSRSVVTRTVGTLQDFFGIGSD